MYIHTYSIPPCTVHVCMCIVYVLSMYMYAHVLDIGLPECVSAGEREAGKREARTRATGKETRGRETTQGMYMCDSS